MAAGILSLICEENVYIDYKEGHTMENKMFCYQCQETAGCSGCTKFGVCGKSPDLAKMQDLLIYTTKGLSQVTTRLREEGKEVSGQVNHLITITYLLL